MAIYDESAGKIVMRLVYDGPATAGKTTNIEQLTSFFTPMRRSELIRSEESAAKRTLYFDWMQLDSGLVHGHELRCHLLTVPGQAVFFHRRRLLLTKADAIVFVLEATQKGLDEARPCWLSMVKLLETEGRSHVPIVVQANKQDMPMVVSNDEIRRSLNLAPKSTVVAAEAQRGTGVRETVVLALRGAANQVQNRILNGGIDALKGRYETAEELRELLREEETKAGATPLEIVFQRNSLTQAAERELAQREAERTRTPAESATRLQEPEPTAPVSESQPKLSAPSITSKTPAADLPPFPDPTVMPGLVWPAAAGREVLRRVPWADARVREDLTASRGTRDGSARDDTYVFEAGLWCLKTSARRHFASLEGARNALLRLAREKTQLGPLLPPQTALAVRAQEHRGAWLWTISPWLETLRSQMTFAVDQKDVARLREALRGFVDAACTSLRLAVENGLVLDVQPSNFGVIGGRCYYVDDDMSQGARPLGIGHALLRRADEYAEFPEAVEDYGEYLLSALDDFTPPETERLGLSQALAETPVQSDGARSLRERLVRRVDAPPLLASGGG